ncbi:hypothetical protein M426DRAFT_160647 [Hypoxylon sp. CI-4A]|nr:hypothetical protein M426DRAFT_160647 [Hypoxylon sp. CI-4A]
MVAEAKHEIIAHLTPLDMDELADEILDRVSEHFLDRALERRLRTIEARSLINALARAERLGYENSDIVGDQKSAFNPAPAPFNPAPHPIPPNTAPQPQHMTNLPQPVRAPPPPPLQCSLCWRKFDNVQPYEYHVSKQVCTKEPPNKEGYPFSCKLCGAGFITKVGQQYHSANRVCGNHGTVAATPLPPINAGSPITVSSGNNSPTQAPPLPPPAPMGTQQHYPVPSQHFSTPTHHSKAPAATPQSSDPYSHLNPKTLEKLNEELHQAEATYSVRFKEAEAIQDPAQRQAKLDGLQNSFSTKQSIIRKKYGVRLRNRRTRAEIDNERQRMGWKHNSPGQPDDTPSAKRRRTDDGPSMLSPQVANNNGDSEGNPVHASVGPEVRSNHLAVSDMQAGLGGSSATASTADPTFSKSTSTQESVPSQDQPQEGPQERESAQNSLSSYQKKGYRVSSHHPPSTETTVGGSATQPTESTQHSGSASAPLVVGEEEDSTDTDSDEDIPASLPLPRPSATPSKSIKG